jgi:hypothetical protein
MAAQCLGASDLINQTYPNPGNIVPREWLIRDGRAVVLQERIPPPNSHGLDVVCFGIDGAAVHSFQVNDNGFGFYQPGIFGIAPVPAHPDWGFLQYSVGNPGHSMAQFIDLTSGLKTQGLEVSSNVGRISSDGALALFRDPSDPLLKTLLPVKMPTRIMGQPLNTLTPVADFFCNSGGDSVAVEGGDIVSAPSSPSCLGNVVRRSHLNAAGQLEITSITTDTGHGPFLFTTGGNSAVPDAPTFVYPGKNRLYNLSGTTGHTLLYLDVTPMTYGPETMTLTASVFF